MSDTIWVDVRGRSKDDVPQDNSIMLRLEIQLDQLSTKLNVPKLSEFYDYSELESMYGDFEGEGATSRRTRVYPSRIARPQGFGSIQALH
jgi:hypothetical protein